MLSTFLLFVIVATAWFWFGRQYERRYGPRQLRHTHAWEIVDQKELPSPSEIAKQSPTQMIAEVAAINRGGYSPNTNSLERLTHREMIVHRRCSLCGDEEVLRI